VKRGIIATAAQIDTFNDSVSIRSGHLSESHIKYFLLYWDKIVIPTNNFVHAGIPFEEDLVRSNIIERPMIKLHGSFQPIDLGTTIIRSELEIINDKFADKEVEWVLHQFNEKLVLPQDKIKKQNVFKFDLIDALPVPNDNIPIHDILEFKERRKDEFNALHETLDELYIDILNSADSDLQAKKSISRLKESLNNIEKIQKEKFKSFTKFSRTLQLNINGKDILDGFFKGSLVDFTLSTEIPIMSIMGAILPMIKISVKQTKTYSESKNKLKLAYLTYAKKENILTL